MRKIALMLTLALYSSSSAGQAEAQKVYHIGSLNTADQFASSFEGFKERMAELGYRERQNIRYEYYNSKGNRQALKGFADKLVQEKVDLIVTSSTTATVAAMKATQRSGTPVVFLSAGNPDRLVKSFISSGTHLTGISSASMELTGKRFELLRELAPSAKKIAVPLDLNGVNYRSIVSETREAAEKLKMTLWEIGIDSQADFGKATASVLRNSADAIFAPPDALVTEEISLLVEQAIKEKLPLITSLLVNVKRGCLATYAADYAALGKQGAVLVDKIFKGAKPADLPIELPYKVKLALNLRTAKAIDLKIPRAVLLRADETFE